MKNQLKKITLLLVFAVVSYHNLYSQEVKRFQLTLFSEFNNQKSKLPLSSFVYTIGNIPSITDVNTLDNIDRFYLSIGGSDPANKELIKMFEPKTQNINGYIEIVDTFKVLPTRKIEFKNATYILTESFSNVSYGDTTNFSINVYTNDLVIDGVSIYSKK